MTVPACLLGVECGGTHTVALVQRPDGSVQRFTAGSCNLRLVSDLDLQQHFEQVKLQTGPVHAIGVGMAGVRDFQDCQRVVRVLNQVWPNTATQVNHDLETALAAADPEIANPDPREEVRVIVLSGTGSCCYGRDNTGKTAKVGGWGHHLGDRGSGYDIVRTALRSTVSTLDRRQFWSPFGAAVLRQLSLNEPNDLIAWMQEASKAEIASLAPLVFESAAQGDSLARESLEVAREDLVADALACARQLSPVGDAVDFVFAGSILLKQMDFQSQVSQSLLQHTPTSRTRPLPRESVWGALVLARQAWESSPLAIGSTLPSQINSDPSIHPEEPLPRSRELSPTEQSNPRSIELDRLPLDAAIELMLTEEAQVPGALKHEKPALIDLIERVHSKLAAGGRLFYVGAGTSGRLGVLDASECPPTFRSHPDQVQGILAGGFPALHRAVEGAEDNIEAGAAALQGRRVGPQDFVLGIAASGRTPFVWGALREALRLGSDTGLLCFNPHLQLPETGRPEWFLAVDVGPEVLTGSTRLKAGTATKLVLNLLTTLCMVRLGKVLGNRMIDLHPSNQKLRERAIRIVCELTGVPPETARTSLEQHHWQVADTVRHLGRSRLDVPSA